MAKFRQIYISFWQNEYIQEEMEPEEKLFYLYLLSGPSSSQIGIYQISKRQMAFDTGFSNDKIDELMDKFINIHKLIDYDEKYREVVIIKWGNLNLNKGGKPIEDLIIKELRKIKNLSFIKYRLEDCRNERLSELIHLFYDTCNDTLTIRKEKKEINQNEDTNAKINTKSNLSNNTLEVNKTSALHDTCNDTGAIKNKEERINNNIYKEKIYKKDKILDYINSLEKSDEVKNKIIEFYSYRKKIKKNFKTTRGIDNLLNQSYDSDNHFIACINYAMDHEYIGVKPEYVKGAGNNGNNKYTRNGSKTNIKPDYGSGFDEFN